MKDASEKACDVFKVWLALLLTLTLLVDFPITKAATNGGTEGNEEKSSSSGDSHHKLLIIMLDGWDYYESQKDELIGFQNFLQEGVQAEWLEPVFPSVSYPCWTTIGTGVYPEIHGVLGNYMFDLQKDMVFDLDETMTTRQEHWWQNAEPIWTTATRYNRKAFLRYWNRCDVPFDQIKPEVCSGYSYVKGVKAFKETLRVAVDSLQKDYDLVMVYAEHLDTIGHRHGPESDELRKAMKDIDGVLADFLDKLVDTGLDEKVNIVILGDHGMKWVGEGSEVTYVSLEDYVNATDVYKVLDRGPVLAITPYAKRVEQVYEGLQRGREAFDVYLRDDIPDHFHYKNNRLVQDILVVAKPNYYIRGLQNSKQIPRDSPDIQFFGGVHGYTNSTEMRTIFFAKGPGFQKRMVHPPLEMVDVYQIFTHLLDIPARPHNGSWTRVSGMLTSRAGPHRAFCDFPTLIASLAVSFTLRFFINNSGALRD